MTRHRLSSVLLWRLSDFLVERRCKRSIHPEGCPMTEECHVSLNSRSEIDAPRSSTVSRMVRSWYLRAFGEVELFDQENSFVLSLCIRWLEEEVNGRSCYSCDSLQPLLWNGKLQLLLLWEDIHCKVLVLIGLYRCTRAAWYKMTIETVNLIVGEEDLSAMTFSPLCRLFWDWSFVNWFPIRHLYKNKTINGKTGAKNMQWLCRHIRREEDLQYDKYTSLVSEIVEVSRSQNVEPFL